ncbi:TIGR03067 domain-containing protein [Aquisphaera insulae]|uniref:TIGR03067 domain-containing protein n=1 Tax=Aquisphaera insulae TaxID=2712864 RepID=UPI0013EDC797|nr:TIGR03067 domain-containing protein [Aquisphaera insulae]
MKTAISTVVLFASLAVSTAFSGEAVQGDLAQLQGRWTAMAGAKKQVQVVMTIRDRVVTVDLKTPTGMNIQVKGELRVDETTSPRSLDWTKFAGPDDQPLPEIAAVYKVEQDTFTVCNGGFLGKRPREFKPGNGAFADVVVFRRLTNETQASRTPEKPAVAAR